MYFGDNDDEERDPFEVFGEAEAQDEFPVEDLRRRRPMSRR